MFGRCALRLRQCIQFARKRGVLSRRGAAGSGSLVARHRQVHAPCEAEIGTGYKRRCAKQADRHGVLGYKGARRKRLAHILLGRSFRNKLSKDVALPHPQSRKDHYRKEDKPSCGGIVRKFFKRTINITEYRNAKDDVNPAKNRTLGNIIHGRLRERGSVHCFAGHCFAISRFTTFEPPEAASWAFQSRIAWRTPRSIAASRRTSWPRRRRCGRWEFR